jgi:predicted small lipoprotein YifL
MKTARILLAALTLATLAACGTESLTGPAVPGAARFETTPAPENGDTVNTDGDTGVRTCSGTVVVTTDASGNTITTCIVSDRGPQIGSGS